MATATSSVQFLETQAEVDAEYCRTERISQKFPCKAPYKRVALIKPPYGFAAQVHSHLTAAYHHRYFTELSRTDLFHGHLILRGPKVKYDSLASFFADRTLILYHSAERNSRWQQQAQQGVAVLDRTPRSFLGYVSGRVMPALSALKFTPSLLQGYSRRGTIYTSQLLKEHPEFSHHQMLGFNTYPKLHVMACDKVRCETCEIRTEFVVLPEAEGRFELKAGEPYDVSFRCTY